MITTINFLKTSSIGLSEIRRLRTSNRTFHVTGSVVSGTGTVDVDIICGNSENPSEGLVLGNIKLTLGTAAVADGFVSNAPWSYCWARVNSITGNGPVVSVFGSYQ